MSDLTGLAMSKVADSQPVTDNSQKTPFGEMLDGAAALLREILPWLEKKQAQEKSEQ